MNISTRTVQSVLKKFRETKTVHDQHGRGRKRKLTKNDVNRMVKKAKKGKTARQLSLEYEKETGKSISDRTIQRTLKIEHLAYLKIKSIPKLDEDDKANRLEYAHNMANLDWKNILFTDEKDFWMETIETHCWQEAGARKTVQKSVGWPKKIHVWGGIGYYHKTRLHFFEKNLTSKLYQKILKKNLPPKCAPDCPRELKKSGT